MPDLSGTRRNHHEQKPGGRKNVLRVLWKEDAHTVVIFLSGIEPGCTSMQLRRESWCEANDKREVEVGESRRLILRWHAPPHLVLVYESKKHLQAGNKRSHQERRANYRIEKWSPEPSSYGNPGTDIHRGEKDFPQSLFNEERHHALSRTPTRLKHRGRRENLEWHPTSPDEWGTESCSGISTEAHGIPTERQIARSRSGKEIGTASIESVMHLSGFEPAGTSYPPQPRKATRQVVILCGYKKSFAQVFSIPSLLNTTYRYSSRCRLLSRGASSTSETEHCSISIEVYHLYSISKASLPKENFLIRAEERKA
ncbi:hypothetical protein IW261DRAFT_1638893 [Armillaria novae-zelandiae]|uniref:Uncharacterized protein n=1 Tax=Armillaria novae-zelandiae TaxID=153914 RepID=A0AA39PQF1_9AGAR|nr:hypothetical protein IW261DRAFT_1638893 [Armillaria novae-zelandiae]